MSVYIGQLGRLIKLPYVTSQSMESADRYTFEETVEGVVRAQVRPVGMRTWSMSATRYLAEAQGTLMSFINGEWGNGPFVWVSADAPVTNLLTPEISSCGPGTKIGSATNLAGPMRLPGGLWAGRSLISSNPSQNMPFGRNVTPVLPGVKVTASAYVIGENCRVGVGFYNAAGEFLEAKLSEVGSVFEPLRRGITAMPPDDAVACGVYAASTLQASRPAITWTDRMFDWADGQGCPSAIIHAASKEVQAAHIDPRGYRAATMPFRATEVLHVAR